MMMMMMLLILVVVVLVLAFFICLCHHTFNTKPPTTLQNLLPADASADEIANCARRLLGKKCLIVMQRWPKKGVQQPYIHKPPSSPSTTVGLLQASRLRFFKNNNKLVNLGGPYEYVVFGTQAADVYFFGLANKKKK